MYYTRADFWKVYNKRSKKMKEKEKRPLPLLRNIRYPSYQLWAIAGDVNNQDNVLKICILLTMQWLRDRFREFDLPSELDYPSPDEFESVALSKFSNIRLKHGYHLEIVWLNDEKSWALQLTEPDLGPSPGKRNQKRRPVAGRIFETNISYQQTDKGVLCGFQTMVSEPDGTDEICEVFRIGVVKHLKRNPLVGLQQIWEFKEEPHVIQSTKDIRGFKKKLMTKERTLPIVVVAEYLPSVKSMQLKTDKVDTSPPGSLPDIDEVLRNSFKNFSSSLDHKLPTQKAKTTQQEPPALPEWLKQLAYERMGYAHVFSISETIRDEFNKVTGYKLTNGGAVLLPAPQAKEMEMHFSHKDVSSEGFCKKLDDLVWNYSKDRHFDFSFCRFVPQALERQTDKMLKDIHTEKDLRKLYEEKLSQSIDQDSKQTAEIEGQHRRKQNKLEHELEDTIKKLKAAEQNTKQQQMRLMLLNSENQTISKRLELTKARPQNVAKVCDWAIEHYGSQIVIHERAQRQMKEIKNEDVDLNLICDALEFLANEYWDELNGIIDLEESLRLCSLYYNRPFEVGECGDRNIRDYPEDYCISHNSKSIQLTHHLKIGKDSKRLVRIYFYYDKADQTILIGSMPKHLRTTSYQ